MLERYTGNATLPAQDLDRAKAYYEEKLGLKPAEERMDGLFYELAAGTGFLLFPTKGEPSGSHTQFGFDVDDIDTAVKELQANGVVFEEYDMPGFKTENGIALIDGQKGAWFKDSEGNLLAIGENVRG
jgi:predicted enzyme related to lactoylglutathione lyase